MDLLISAIVGALIYSTINVFFARRAKKAYEQQIERCNEKYTERRERCKMLANLLVSLYRTAGGLTGRGGPTAAEEMANFIARKLPNSLHHRQDVMFSGFSDAVTQMGEMACPANPERKRIQIVSGADGWYWLSNREEWSPSLNNRLHESAHRAMQDALLAWADTTEVEIISNWSNRTKDWSKYPFGTQAQSSNGQRWTKMNSGWRAAGGDLFATPGASADKVLFPKVLIKCVPNEAN